MIFKEYNVNAKVYYILKFIIILILILIIYKYYFGFKFENFSSNTTNNKQNIITENNINSVFNENHLFVDDLVINGSFNILPKYSIVAWTSPDIPYGWAVCDGKNDTPDLRGRFIVGSGIGKDCSGNDLTERKLKEYGGEEKHILLENEIPPHGHEINTYSGRNALWVMNGFAKAHCSDVLRDGNNPYGTTLIPNDGTKEVETNAHDNMPPFYILYYIMRYI